MLCSEQLCTTISPICLCSACLIHPARNAVPEFHHNAVDITSTLGCIVVVAEQAKCFDLRTNIYLLPHGEVLSTCQGHRPLVLPSTAFILQDQARLRQSVLYGCRRRCGSSCDERGGQDGSAKLQYLQQSHACGRRQGASPCLMSALAYYVLLQSHKPVSQHHQPASHRLDLPTSLNHDGPVVSCTILSHGCAKCLHHQLVSVVLGPAGPKLVVPVS